MKSRKMFNKIKARRIRRVRAVVSGTKERPRLAVFRSNRFIYGQLIDDRRGATLLSVSVKDLKGGSLKTKSEKARAAGELIAKRAAAHGITKVVFDRRSYRYHGRIKAFAEGARQGGLSF